MDDKNSSNVRHPLHAALMIFHATLRTAFETAALAAYKRPGREAIRSAFGTKQTSALSMSILRGKADMTWACHLVR
jgi:hypothetical protein